LEMKPRTGLAASRRRYDEMCRVDTSTTCGKWVGSRGQLCRDIEAVDARQLDIQHYHLRAKTRGGGQRRRRVCRFPDYLKAFRLQQRPSGGPEAIVVIDDQHRAGHP
jgi:hypothetical protein